MASDGTIWGPVLLNSYRVDCLIYQLLQFLDSCFGGGLLLVCLFPTEVVRVSSGAQI